MTESEHTPAVSVVMAVYNGAHWVGPAVESILGQSWADFEFIVIDDGSTDDGVSIIRQFEDRRIRIVCNRQNMGLAESLNRGFRLARGEFVARMDADDISHPQRLEKQLAYLRRNPELGGCGTWSEILGRGGRWRNETDPDRLRCLLLFGSAFSHPTMMFRRTLIDSGSAVYDTDYASAQDYDLWVRLAGTTRLSNLPEVLLQYRIHPQQTGQARTESQRAAARKIQKRQLLELGISPSPDELMLHGELGRGEYQASSEFVDRVGGWLEKIMRANEERGLLPKEAMDAVLGQTWMACCSHASGNGISIWHRFRQTSLRASDAWSRRRLCKLFVNCLISRKRC